MEYLERHGCAAPSGGPAVGLTLVKVFENELFAANADTAGH